MDIFKNNKKGEKGSITLFVLSSVIFFVIIGSIAYSNVFNKLLIQQKQMKEIDEKYEQISNENKMQKEYEEAINKSIYIVLYKKTGEVYRTSEWTNEDLKMKIYYSDEIPEDERYFYKDGEKLQYDGEYTITENCVIESKYKDVEAKVVIDKMNKANPALNYEQN